MERCALSAMCCSAYIPIIVHLCQTGCNLSFVTFAVAVVIHALSPGRRLFPLSACTTRSHRTITNHVLNMYNLRFLRGWLWAIMLCSLFSLLNSCLQIGGTCHPPTDTFPVCAYRASFLRNQCVYFICR